MGFNLYTEIVLFFFCFFCFFVFFFNSSMLMGSQVCREWESAALRVDKDVRLARIRIGVVLGKEGGALGAFYH